MREQRLAAGWMRELETVATRIGAFVPRLESRARVGRFLRVTVAGDARRNGWQLAEAAAEATPQGMQRLMASAAWDVDAVRDDLRAYVVDALGTQDSVLIVDETGFLKKGTKSAGVQRQYSGTAGRIENCQIGVFLAYATPRGHAFVDRDLYVPESWITDRPRCREAGIPETVTFRTKPQLAQAMLARALAGGFWATKCTAMIARCGCGSRVSTSPFSSPFARTNGCGSCSTARLAKCASVQWPTRCPPPRGGGAVPGRAARARAFTTGPPFLSRASARPGTMRCSCVAILRRATERTTSCSPRGRSR